MSGVQTICRVIKAKISRKKNYNIKWLLLIETHLLFFKLSEAIYRSFIQFDSFAIFSINEHSTESLDVINWCNNKINKMDIIGKNWISRNRMKWKKIIIVFVVCLRFCIQMSATIIISIKMKETLLHWFYYFPTKKWKGKTNMRRENIQLFILICQCLW